MTAERATHPIVRIPLWLYKQLDGMFIARSEGNMLQVHPLIMTHRGSDFPHNHTWQDTEYENLYECTKCRMRAKWTGEIMEVKHGIQS